MNFHLQTDFPFTNFSFSWIFFRFECDNSQIWTDGAPCTINSTVWAYPCVQIWEFKIRKMFSPKMAPPIEQPDSLQEQVIVSCLSCNFNQEPVLRLWSTWFFPKLKFVRNQASLAIFLKTMELLEGLWTFSWQQHFQTSWLFCYSLV